MGRSAVLPTTAAKASALLDRSSRTIAAISDWRSASVSTPSAWNLPASDSIVKTVVSPSVGTLEATRYPGPERSEAGAASAAASVGGDSYASALEGSAGAARRNDAVRATLPAERSGFMVSFRGVVADAAGGDAIACASVYSLARLFRAASRSFFSSSGDSCGRSATMVSRWSVAVSENGGS